MIKGTKKYFFIDRPTNIFCEITPLISPDPVAWFVGQFVKFILRPKPWVQRELEVLKKYHPGIGFKVFHLKKLFIYIYTTGPAMQVRRQDKFRESPFVEVGKYVEYLSEYFDLQELKYNYKYQRRSVYVATGKPRIACLI